MEEIAVTLQSGSGPLRGTLVNPRTRAPLVVVFRGVAFSRPKPGDRGYLGLARDIAAAGFASLFVSFRGTDDSPGVFSMHGWSEDAHSVMAYAATLGFDRIALVGASAGAATALRYAAIDDGVAAVASLASPALLAQTFPREQTEGFMRMVARAALPTAAQPGEPDAEAFYSDLIAHDPFDVISRISPTPLLLMQGDADEFVSVKTARRLFDAAGDPKEMMIMPGAGHALRLDPQAVAALVDWLKQVLGVS